MGTKFDKLSHVKCPAPIKGHSFSISSIKHQAWVLTDVGCLEEQALGWPEAIFLPTFTIPMERGTGGPHRGSYGVLQAHQKHEWQEEAGNFPSLGQNLPFLPPPNYSGTDLGRPGLEWKCLKSSGGLCCALFIFLFRKFWSLRA